MKIKSFLPAVLFASITVDSSAVAGGPTLRGSIEADASSVNDGEGVADQEHNLSLRHRGLTARDPLSFDNSGRSTEGNGPNFSEDTSRRLMRWWWGMNWPIASTTTAPPTTAAGASGTTESANSSCQNVDAALQSQICVETQGLLWPSCRGLMAEDCKCMIKKCDPTLKIYVILRGSPVTADFVLDRVRIYDDENGVVVSDPING